MPRNAFDAKLSEIIGFGLYYGDRIGKVAVPDILLPLVLRRTNIPVFLSTTKHTYLSICLTSPVY